MKKHKKKHGLVDHKKNIPNVSVSQTNIEIEKDREQELASAIEAASAEINSVGLAKDDLADLQARLAAANAKLAAAQKAVQDAAQADAYATLKAEQEAKIAAFEELSSELFTPESIVIAKAAKVAIDTGGLSDEDTTAFEARIIMADEKVAVAQNAIDKAIAYAATKAEMERKIAAIEMLANASSLEAAREKDKALDYAVTKSEMEKKIAAVEALANAQPLKVTNKTAEAETNIVASKFSYVDSEELEEEQRLATSLKFNRNKILVAAFMLLVLGSYGISYAKKVSANNDLALKDKTEKYIKDNLVPPGTDLKISSFAKEGDLYKFTVSVAGKDIVSYLTGDGKRLLLNPIDLDQNAATPSANAAAPTNAASASAAPAPAATVSQKQDVPSVELFVMSYCPYGTQIEKGILPVLDKLGSKINFKLNFVDYSLHGPKEVAENLTQYCIQKEEPSKLTAYLKSFDSSSDSDASLTAAGIDKNKITTCVSATDKQNNITQDANNATGSSAPFNLTKADNDKYGVQGSPTLVVNGTVIDAGRDSASLLNTICAGFNNQPAECKATLSSTSPAPGFGN